MCASWPGLDASAGAEIADVDTGSATKASLFGLDLDLLTMPDTVAACEDLINRARPAQQSSLNAAKVVLAAHSAEVRDSLRHADLLTADGQSVVWAGRLLGIPVPERVAGIDLMEHLLGLAEAKGFKVFFLGAREEVLDQFAEVVRDRYPALKIAGRRNGYFDNGSDVARTIRASGAQLLLIALPSPAKEFFVEQYRGELGPLLAVGVGGSFDVWAGVTTRAPRWMQRTGLEWLFRLIQEPGKMWRRYLVGNTRFILMTLGEAASKARHQTALTR
jgi:N-acetylglucosaminyldiphosphoundecaprenol N-acetyl-beta-D-mannosaminyltransferase